MDLNADKMVCRVVHRSLGTIAEGRENDHLNMHKTQRIVLLFYMKCIKSRNTRNSLQCSLLFNHL